MAINTICQGIISGLSTDTKPSRFANGTILIETDTGLFWRYVSALPGWVVTSIPTPEARKFGTWTGQATASTGGWSGLWGAPTAIAVGTGTTNILRDSTGVRLRFDTGATINSLSGIRLNSVGFTERDLNPEFHIKVKPVTSTDMKIFIGFTSGTAAPVSNTDYLNALSGVGFWVNTATDANWHIMQNNGSGASDITTLANIGAFNTNTITLALRAVNASGKFQYSFDNGPWVDISTDIPAAATGLGWIWYVENITAVTKQLAVWWGWTMQDA